MPQQTHPAAPLRPPAAPGLAPSPPPARSAVSLLAFTAVAAYRGRSGAAGTLRNRRADPAPLTCTARPAPRELVEKGTTLDGLETQGHLDEILVLLLAAVVAVGLFHRL